MLSSRVAPCRASGRCVTAAACTASVTVAARPAAWPQDRDEEEDNQQVTKFIWLMRKKTLLGIHRFEELIHTEFEKLVGIGFLKLKDG